MLAVVALAVAVGIGVCRAKTAAADAALRAVFTALLVLSAAGLAADTASQTVMLAGGMRHAGSGITFLAFRAVLCIRNVYNALDRFAAVEAFRAVLLRGFVRANGSYRAANIASGVAKICVRMLRAGNCHTAVFANGAIGGQCLVAVTSTNIVAMLASNVVLVCIFVRGDALKSAVLTVADFITNVGVDMAKRRFTLAGLGIGCATYCTKLLLNLCFKAGCGRLGNPFAPTVRDFSLKITAFTVTIGITGIVVIVIQRIITRARLFAAASGANTILNFCFKAGCGCLGGPFAILMIVLIDNSYEITVLTVAIGIAIVLECMTECGLAGRGFFSAANIAETMQYLRRCAGCSKLCFKFGDIRVGCFSGIIAFCAVAGNVACVVEYVSKCLADLSGLFSAANGTISDLNTGILAIGRSLAEPSAEIVNVLTNRSAVVANCITCIIVLVIVDGSGCAADVAITVAGVIIGVGLGNSEFAADVTVRIALRGVDVVGSHSELTANVAGGVTCVGVLVRFGNSQFAADVAGFVAGVGVNVCGSSFCAAGITGCVTIRGINMLVGLSGCAAGVAFAVTGAVILVRECFAGGAANIAGSVGAICEGVLCLRCARAVLTVVASGITRT